MLRIAICDDDKILVTQIEEMLNRYLDKKMIDRYIEIFYDGASLERIYEKGDRFDIIYLDIEMSGKNGIEAAKSIRRLDTCSKLIILIIVRIVKLFRVSGIKRLDYMNWLANVSMTAGSLYIVYNLYLLSLNETKLLGSTMSSIIILLLNVICFKMFDKIAADAEIKRKNDIYKQSIDIYKREMEEREEHNEKLRRFRHDIKNHLIAIEKLALSKEYVRLRDYIHQLTDEKGVLQVTTISGNALIDGLLADKFDVARKYEIAVEYHIEIPTKLPFDDADLCIIVGNALDNAIDGTKDIEGAKKIEISMGVKQGNFLLKVKNTFNPELIKFDNNGKRLRTSKTDKSNHGMGIGLIEETALKYNGLMEITMNENIFCLSVLLYQN